MKTIATAVLAIADVKVPSNFMNFLLSSNDPPFPEHMVTKRYILCKMIIPFNETKKISLDEIYFYAVIHPLLQL